MIQRNDGTFYNTDVHYYGQVDDDTWIFDIFYEFHINDINIDFYINGKDKLYATPDKNTDRKIADFGERRRSRATQNRYSYD